MTLETMLTKVSNYSSHIGDVVINEGAPPPTEEEDDVNNNDDRIAILEAEIASRKAEISRLKGGIDVNNDTNDNQDNQNSEQLAKVQAEVAVVKENARMLLRHMAAQTTENEQLQSDLDRVREELGDSLAEASVEIIQRGNKIEQQDRLLVELQTKYNDVLEQLNHGDNSSQTIINALQSELNMIKDSSSQLKDALNEQITQLKEKLETTKNEAETTINRQSKELRMLGEEYRNEKNSLNIQIDTLRKGIKTMANELKCVQQMVHVKEQELQIERKKSLGGDSAGNNRLHAPSLGDLAALWEQRLDENRKSRGIPSSDDAAVPKNGSYTAADDGKTNDDDTNCSPDGNTLPSTINTAEQNNNNNDGSTSAAASTTDDGTSTTDGPSPRRTNGILNLFGGGKKKSVQLSAATQHDLVQERDRTIDELETMLCANVEVIKHIKCAIDELDVTAMSAGEEEDNGAADTATARSAENLAKLKEALASLGSNEASSNKTPRVKMKLKDALGGSLSDVSMLQMTVKTLESTVSLQEMQNMTLKEELSRLQNIVNDVDTYNSSQEDEIEKLRAKVIKLELKSQLQEDEKRTMEEALGMKLKGREDIISNIENAHNKEISVLENQSSSQEDLIGKLQAEITKLHVQSDIQAEEKRNAMEEIKTKIELSALEIPSSPFH